MANDTFKILAIDGGGIRGIYPARFLAELEKEIEGQIWEYFDLIAGTSTGAIIAIALALEIPAERILALYREKGSTIFGQRHFSQWILPKYKNEPLIGELKKVFGNRLLKEARCRLCIPAVNLLTGSTKVFKTPHFPHYFVDLEIEAWKIAASSSAAPTYFAAFSTDGENSYVDGGMWANNPGLVAVTEALHLKKELRDIMLLSIGTGKTKQYFPSGAARKAGLLQWAPKFMGFNFGLQSLAVENHLKHFPLKAYERINSDLHESIYTLDNFGKAAELDAVAMQQVQTDRQKVLQLFFTKKSTPFLVLDR